MGGEKDSRFRGLFRHRLEAHAYKSAAGNNAAMAKAAADKGPPTRFAAANTVDDKTAADKGAAD